jgi:hypothetical protein
MGEFISLDGLYWLASVLVGPYIVITAWDLFRDLAGG